MSNERDIVEELHEYARGIFAEPAARGTLAWKAADEIERLREALDHTIKHGVSAAQLQETVE